MSRGEWLCLAAMMSCYLLLALHIVVANRPLYDAIRSLRKLRKERAE